MMKPVYILSACAISPQHSFEPSGFLQDIKTSNTGKLFVVDPDYRQFINPVAIRRMSRIIKMGITAGMKALETAGIKTPDAIITGTGLGSMTDTERFLNDMITYEEQVLNPTYFIQSTYNSTNGWLAMQTKCTGYNQTYVNRGLSLELSLLDAQMLLNENSGVHHVLVGCFDEMTDEYFIVKSKVNYWKKESVNSVDLLRNADTPGTIGGEGTSFFTISDSAEKAVCCIKEVKMIPEPDGAKLAEEIDSLLGKHELNLSEIDLVLCGMNGDSGSQPLYEEALTAFAEGTTVAAFKHLTGEYPTASGFALWLVVRLFQTKEVPEPIVVKKGNSPSFRNVLVVNHYILNTASLFLISAE
jgi:hypothetical protein